MTSDVLAKFMDQLLTAYATLVILNSTLPRTQKSFEAIAVRETI